jgi:hypothetical protein
MLRSLLEIMKQLLGLAKDTQENKDDIKALQTRLETVTETLERVIFELQRLKENEAHEREKWDCVWRIRCFAPTAFCRRAIPVNRQILQSCKGRSRLSRQK